MASALCFTNPMEQHKRVTSLKTLQTEASKTLLLHFVLYIRLYIVITINTVLFSLQVLTDKVLGLSSKLQEGHLSGIAFAKAFLNG